MGTEFQFGRIKEVPEMDGGDGCTALWVFRITEPHS